MLAFTEFDWVLVDFVPIFIKFNWLILTSSGFNKILPVFYWLEPSFVGLSRLNRSSTTGNLILVFRIFTSYPRKYLTVVKFV